MRIAPVILAGLMAACGGQDVRGTQPPPVTDWNSDPRPIGKTLVYECADYEFVTRLGPGEMAIWLEDRYMVLSQVRAASGVKYEEGDTVFWMKGEEASLLLDGQRFTGCQLNHARAPWEDARRRGVDFRAVGNEPGWHLEIQSGRQILFIGNYGMQRVMLPDPGQQQVGDTLVYEAAGNGNELRVEISGETCTDTMKGDAFPASVLLHLNGIEYRGCGMTLDHPWE
jgi:putative lipoprotein